MIDSGLSANAEIALIRQVQARAHSSSNAFKKLEKAYAPMLSAYKRRVDFSPHQELEVEQDLRLAFHVAIRNFDPDCGHRLAPYAKTYLAGKAIEITNHFKTERQGPLGPGMVKSLDELSGAFGDNLASDQGAHATSITHAVIVQETLAHDVEDFLATCTASQQEVIGLLYWDHCNLAEAASLLGITRQGVHKHLSKVIKAGQIKLLKYAV